LDNFELLSVSKKTQSKIYNIPLLYENFFKFQHEYFKCEELLRLTIKKTLEIKQLRSNTLYVTPFNIHHPIITTCLKDILITNRKAVPNAEVEKNLCNQYIADFIIHVAETSLSQELSLIEIFNIIINGHLSIRLAEKHAILDFFKAIQKITGKNVDSLLFNAPYSLAKYLSNQTEKHIVIKNMLRCIVAEKYGFQIDTKWKPEQPIENFLICLKERGFLLAQGLFGKRSYNSEPIITTVGEIKVLSWQEQTFKNNNSLNCEMMVFIGASRKGYQDTTQDLIYYIDPADNIGGKTPIYIVPYLAFTQRLISTYGHGIAKFQELDISKEDMQSMTFFFYHPAHAPQLESSIIASKQQQKPAAPKIAQLSPMCSTLSLSSPEKSTTQLLAQPVISITASHEKWGGVYTGKYVKQPANPAFSQISSAPTFFKPSASSPEVGQSSIAVTPQPSQADNRTEGEVYRKYIFSTSGNAEELPAPLEASGLLKTLQDGLADIKKLTPTLLTHPYALRMIFIRILQALALHGKMENIHFTFDDCIGFTLTNILTHCYFKVTPLMLENVATWLEKNLAQPVAAYLKNKKVPLPNNLLLSELQIYKQLTDDLKNCSQAQTGPELLKRIKDAFTNIQQFTEFTLPLDTHYAITMNLVDAVECFNNLQNLERTLPPAFKKWLPQEIRQFLIDCRQLIRNPERHAFNYEQQEILLPALVTHIPAEDLKQVVAVVPYFLTLLTDQAVKKQISTAKAPSSSPQKMDNLLSLGHNMPSF
jgi:hypothetical protein